MSQAEQQEGAPQSTDGDTQESSQGAHPTAQGDIQDVPPGDAHELLLTRREPEIRAVDFSQPTKFTPELRRRVVRLLGPFCEAFALRLSTELRTHVELAVGDASQLTWAAAKAQMSADAIAVALEVAPIERQMLLCIEPPLILQALECLLGGAASQAPSERRLSDVDWALTRRLLHSMVAHLNPAWRDLGGLELALGEVDLEGDAGVIAPIGEPTLVLTFESRIDSLPARMSLLIPWSAIEPVAAEILGGGSPAADADPSEGRAVHRGLARAHISLRAEVGAVRMPVEQMLALNPGALFALPDRAEEGIQLFAEGIPLGRARPGLRGARRAIKLTEPIDPGTSPVAGAGSGASAAGGPQPRAETGELDVEVGEAGEHFPRAALARMMGVPVRVWAELGRTTLPLGQALEMPPGTVVELDQGAEDPIELFVNGMPFAHGTLQVGADGEWAVQIDALL
ncbi:MAG TPA: FliM/FliN family flagellar motor switch protein [Solirubrobacteraceae bacterium]|jgi:flagellar motor switch protein FliM|nr:FliM/FliN family flagellar motor switch protein [Solirubrobacteraceae bacterium]